MEDVSERYISWAGIVRMSAMTYLRLLVERSPKNKNN